LIRAYCFIFGAVQLAFTINTAIARFTGVIALAAMDNIALEVDANSTVLHILWASTRAFDALL